MSDTPRTDLAQIEGYPFSYVDADFSRYLERELVAAIASFSEERERAQREGARVIKLQGELAEAKAQRDKVRKPMTDGEIYECYRAMFITTPTDSAALRTIKYFARAIERAHGIGAEKGE